MAEVQYVSLVKDHVDTIDCIFKDLGMEQVMTDEYKDIISSEIKMQKETRKKTKLHSYTLEKFGLSDVSNLPYVEKYHAEFQVVLEKTRIF